MYQSTRITNPFADSAERFAEAVSQRGPHQHNDGAVPHRNPSTVLCAMWSSIDRRPKALFQRNAPHIAGTSGVHADDATSHTGANPVQLTVQRVGKKAKNKPDLDA